MIFGQGNYRYKAVPGWGVLDARTPVSDCHAMVIDAAGRILLLTNNTRNNVIIYDRAGNPLGTWGHAFPGAHGMTLVDENGEQFLFITDHDLHQVYKTTLDGRILMTLDAPREAGDLFEQTGYKPTDVAVAPNGDFYVMDGYGTSLILVYDAKGSLKSMLGGRGFEPQSLNQAHGGVVDLRNPSLPLLLITSRLDQSIKRFTLDGHYIDTLSLPNTQPCDVIFDGDIGYIPQLRMADDNSHGFVTIIDRENRVISNPGGAPPVYDSTGKLQPLQRQDDLFTYPHGLCVDNEGSIYVAQWNSGKTYPIKLQKV
jgi:peptidylamidoglycolate lyase